MCDLGFGKRHFFHEDEVFDLFFVFKLSLTDCLLKDWLLYLILHEK